MDTNKMREQFEAWYSAKFPEPEGLAGSAPSARKYRADRKEMLFSAWNSSREAVVVELPKDIVTMAGPVLYADDIRAAIEAQGLKVEVKP
ncbi:hypothetical protein [Pseudomonas putida]|uniref:hypothetical protein n=1 Tax=Pseudomonas putida TaxID=303 RepID=UPI0035A51EAF